MGHLPPRYRIYSAEDILKHSAPYLDTTGEIFTHCHRYADVLLRARKSAAAILSSIHVADCGLNRVPPHLIRYAVLDDTPLVWEQDDWPWVVPVPPFTLGHRDTANYWSHDEGEVVFQVLQRLLIHQPTRRTAGSGVGGVAAAFVLDEQDDDDCWWSQYMVPHSDDTANACQEDERDTCSTNNAAVASAAAAVVDEDDDDDYGVAHQNNYFSEFPSSSSSSWKHSADVEDVVPL
jgi:hypothetical protein